MNFDAEVDAARMRLEASLVEPCRAADRTTLLSILPELESALASRRLSFALRVEEESAVIDVLHCSGQALGEISVDGEELVFDTAEQQHFEGFLAERGVFIPRLYEALKEGLPQFESDLDA